jgi:hypothetical protein
MNAHMELLDFEDRANKTSIRLAVLTLHAAIFLFIAFVATPSEIKKSAQKLVVRTVRLDSPKARSTTSLPEKSALSEVQKSQIHEEIAIAPAPIDSTPIESVAVEEPVQQKFVQEESIQEKPNKPEVIEKIDPVPVPDQKQSKPEQKSEPKPQPKATAKVQAKVQSKPIPKPQSKPQAKAQVKPKPQPKIQAPPQTKPQPKVQDKAQSKPVDKEKEAEAKKRAQAEAQAAAQRLAQNRAKALAEAKRKAAAEAEAKQNALISEALQSLNSSGSIDQKKGKIASSVGSAVSSPKKITSLASDSLVTIESEGEKFTGKEKTYYDELVHRLKLELRLPDFGDVKIKLTLNRSGKVLKIECIKAKSAKNKAYLEKAIAKIVFPAFGQNFPKEESHTFRLHLTNELSY